MQANAPELDPSYGIVRETIELSNQIQRRNLTPKSFLQTFLSASHIELAYRRRYWATERGWPSTLSILGSIRDLTVNTPGGGDRWRDFILSEVIGCILSAFQHIFSSLSLYFHFPFSGKVICPRRELAKRRGPCWCLPQCQFNHPQLL